MRNDEKTDDDQTAYHLCVLRKMFKVLPASIDQNLCWQLEKFLEALQVREKIFHDKVLQELQDVQVLMAAMQFDLESTKNERDFYKKKAGE
jgi:hypothetical protein